MLAIIVASFAYLAFGPGFDVAYGGYGALILLPFAFGALYTGHGGVFSWLGCLGAPIALMVVSIALAYAGLEGLICVAMVMPPWIVAALGGGFASWWLNQRQSDDENDNSGGTRFNAMALATLPLALIYAEELSPPDWESHTVARSVVVDADRSEIWPLLVSIPDIGPDEGKPTFTHDWLRMPRPTQAELVQRDGQIVRIANWGSQIRFEEQIDTISPADSISWKFVFPDDSVQQHTDRHISPDGPILQIDSGKYELLERADGKTEIKLTTTYQMRTRLGWYYAWWGEWLLGDVQENVLAIVAQRAG